MTRLDAAHAAMEAAPEDETLRLRYYDRLVETELVLLLEATPKGEVISPRVVPLEDGEVVLAFDTEARLAAFAGEAAYAELSGRRLLGLLAGQGLGLGVNLGVASSAFLLDAAGVDWLADALSHAPAEMEARPVEVAPPGAVPEAVVAALDAKLPAAAGLTSAAYLAGVGYADGRSAHLLAFADVADGAERALAAAVGEALVFSGVEAGALDVAFLGAQDPLLPVFARHALRFDIPARAEAVSPTGPGTDPDRPPRLR
ncbi:SseB family protein [Ovoidimarina sediminis]|uniref:SseB family protein n=1 Tax=Ovoidimarina sediminis TaxID=3079856 RepID=UPI002914E39F|nr:SseB family protein [Rhodophyticola sp. MJ-SS7]MDU8944760.1 SseB family protein [Rhodophyticola sp. MJ-SS7]